MTAMLPSLTRQTSGAEARMPASCLKLQARAHAQRALL